MNLKDEENFVQNNEDHHDNEENHHDDEENHHDDEEDHYDDEEDHYDDEINSNGDDDKDEDFILRHDDHDEDSGVENDGESLEKLTINISRTANTHASCFICQEKHGPFKTISNEAIVEIFLITNIIIPIGNRCCSKHLTDGGFVVDIDLENLRIWKKNTILYQKVIEIFFRTSRENNSKNQNLFSKFSEFEHLDSELCLKISNLYKDDFFSMQ